MIRVNSLKYILVLNKGGEWVPDLTLPSSEPEPGVVVFSGEAAEKRLLETNECVRCDLRGVNLGGADISGADLRSATHRGASLRNTTMTNADLRWASLRHANFGTFGSLLGFEIGRDKSDFERVKFCNTSMLDGSINNRDC